MAGVIAEILVDKAIDAARKIIEDRRERKTAVAGEVTPAETETLRGRLQSQIARNPVIENATNQEPLPASRTFMGGTSSLTAWIAAAGVIFSAWQSGAFDDAAWAAVSLLVTAIVGTLANLVTMIGRAKSGLAPMNWNPLSWFGLTR